MNRCGKAPHFHFPEQQHKPNDKEGTKASIKISAKKVIADLTKKKKVIWLLDEMGRYVSITLSKCRQCMEVYSRAKK